MLETRLVSFAKDGQEMKVLAKVIASLIALSAAAARVFLPGSNVDLTTTILIIIAALPWLAELIDTAELPGGWKFKFRSTLRETTRKAEEIGLAAPTLTKSEENRYSFELVGLEDPNLALAGLRIEIERRLRSIAESNGVSAQMMGLGGLLNALSRQRLLDEQERGIIADLTGLLNGAVHGGKVDNQSASWALDLGKKILKTLDSRVGRKSKKPLKRQT